MDVKLLGQAERCLSKCGKPIAPPGVSVVYLYRGIGFQTTQATASNSTIQKEVQGDTIWELRALSGLTTASTALYLQVQLPDGRFLFNALMDITQIVGYGSGRYAFSRPLPCPPGTKISITLDTNIPASASAQQIALLFEGADRYYLTPTGKLAPCYEAFAAALPRYQGDPSQNIMAPCWQQGFTVNPPLGYEDENATYPSGPFGLAPGNVTLTVGSTLTGTAQINLDHDYEFEARRLLVNTYADSGVTAGSILGRVRDGSGYALTDDYINLANTIGSAPWPKGWVVKPGSAIYFDIQLVDGAGSGNVYFQAFAEGVRRRI